MSRTPAGKVKVKSKKSSNSLLFPDMRKKSCFNFHSPLSGSTDFNFSILPVPALSNLKATAFSAVCKERSDVDVSVGLVGQPCAGCGMGPDMRLLRSGGGAAETDLNGAVCAAETDFNGALGAAETDLNGAVCAVETDFHGIIPRSRSLSQLRGDAGVVAGEVCFSQDRGQVADPVPRDVSVLAELEGVCVRRRKAFCSACVDSDISRIQVGSGRNSRIHGSQSFFLHVHVCLLVVCLVHAVSVLLLLLLVLRVCLLCALVRVLVLQRLHVEGWLWSNDMHVIQLFLVASCLCRSPPTTTWVRAGRVSRGGGVPKVGFPVRPKICSLSQRWRQG